MTPRPASAVRVGQPVTRRAGQRDVTVGRPRAGAVETGARQINHITAKGDGGQLSGGRDRERQHPGRAAHGG